LSLLPPSRRRGSMTGCARLVKRQRASARRSARLDRDSREMPRSVVWIASSRTAFYWIGAAWPLSPAAPHCCCPMTHSPGWCRLDPPMGDTLQVDRSKWDRCERDRAGRAGAGFEGCTKRRGRAGPCVGDAYPALARMGAGSGRDRSPGSRAGPCVGVAYPALARMAAGSGRDRFPESRAVPRIRPIASAETESPQR